VIGHFLQRIGADFIFGPAPERVDRIKSEDLLQRASSLLRPIPQFYKSIAHQILKGIGNEEPKKL
jgi:hypothetical protein